MEPSKLLRILATGGTGLVGSRLVEMLSPYYNVATPTRLEMDSTNADQVSRYIEAGKPSILIHTAAFTDATIAERERGNLLGSCWKLNVEGTQHIAAAAKRIGAWVIYISTGSVFSGDAENPGPFPEDYPLPDSPDNLSWSGWTKACAEKILNNRAIILRISHPVKLCGPSVERDYVHKLLDLYDKGTLFSLFDDQWFPLTYIDDLALSINKVIQNITKGMIQKEKTIYHVASPDLSTPYLLARAVIEKARGVVPELPHRSMDEFLKTTRTPLRFTKYCALDVAKTQKDLGLSFKPWKKIVDELWDRNALSPL